jgi:hypothetical protein
MAVNAAAPSQGLAARGAPRLLEHCAAMERLTSAAPARAHARLEHELGGHLARLLCRALAPVPGDRAAFLSI